MCVEPFPTDNHGLTSLEPQEKRDYVERFRVLLSLWPGFPSDLGSLMPSATSSQVWTVEKKLANFYTQSFFDNFGHPPVVLHLIPNPPPHYLPIRGVLNSLFVCLWIHAFFFARCEDFFFFLSPLYPSLYYPARPTIVLYFLAVRRQRSTTRHRSVFILYIFGRLGVVRKWPRLGVLSCCPMAWSCWIVFLTLVPY